MVHLRHCRKNVTGLLIGGVQGYWECKSAGSLTDNLALPVKSEISLKKLSILPLNTASQLANSLSGSALSAPLSSSASLSHCTWIFLKGLFFCLLGPESPFVHLNSSGPCLGESAHDTLHCTKGLSHACVFFSVKFPVLENGVSIFSVSAHGVLKSSEVWLKILPTY